ncbi:uncharacterized protein LOC26536187 [Drosophila yakuba]|uniref:Uncharacterized protein n=1 Tax=Drosophila yakuba TaxID=7245 RepID=A0A0R1DLL1_DROYA|nr:uncharacterized protein LOC26536187 [Drosophila yakuba]KRJ98251.1 uncharacterized protein Dyak_GE29006 [Drosophila yakuba]
MRVCTIFLVLFCVLHISNSKPFLFVVDHIQKHFENKFAKLHEIFNGKSEAEFVTDNTKPNSDNKENTSPDKDVKRKFLNTLIKLCKSETGNGKNPGLDASLGEQKIRNLNTITNNISMPEIILPPITVVIVKDQKALEKYQEKSKNATIIIRPASRTKDAKPAFRSRYEKRTQKGLPADVKKCVLMKIKELNVIRA